MAFYSRFDRGAQCARAFAGWNYGLATQMILRVGKRKLISGCFMMGLLTVR